MAQDAQLISQASKVESLASDGLVSVSTGAGQPQKNIELAKFADSLGSSVPLQQTSEQVNITGLYARTSDGKMVELTKESVASVMGNLLYGATNASGLASVIAEKFSQPRMKSGDSLNSYKSFGSYMRVNVDVTEAPSGVSKFGALFVTQGETDYACMQYYFDKDAGVYTRMNWGSAYWSEWQRIDNFGYNTLAELSSGVTQQIGVKNGSFYVKKGLPVTLSLGSGILFLKSEGTQHSGCFDVQYWTAEIKPIGGVFSSSYINVTKNSGSANVTIGVRDDAAQDDYEMKYILIG